MFSSGPSPASCGRAFLRRWSSMTIRRATVASHGSSEAAFSSSWCALRHARIMVSCTTSSAQCRSPPVRRSTNDSSGRP
jgi:hypothetical protein